MEVLTLLKFTRTTPFFQKPSCKGQFAQLWPGNEVRRIAGWNRPRCVCFSFEVSFFFCFGTFLAVHNTPISQVLFQTSNAPTWVSRTQMQTWRIALKPVTETHRKCTRRVYARRRSDLQTDFKSAIFGRLSWKPKLAADLKSRLVGKSQLPLIKNEWDPMQDRAVLPCHSLFDCLFLPEPVSCRGQRIARSNGKRNRSFTRNKTTFAAVFEVRILIAMFFSFFFFFKYCNSKHLCAPHGARIHRPKCIRLTENCKKKIGYHFVKNGNASTHQPAHRKICLTPIMCIDMHFHSILFSLLLILPNTSSLILWCSYTEQLNKIKVHLWGSG